MWVKTQNKELIKCDIICWGKGEKHYKEECEAVDGFDIRNQDGYNLGNYDSKETCNMIINNIAEAIKNGDKIFEMPV